MRGRDDFWTYCLICIALILLFLNLGTRPLFGAEGRWAEGAREMILRNSWFVPTINFHPHITKPLLPFWFIRISEKIGAFNELSVRIPGAILAFLSFLSMVSISRRLFTKPFDLVSPFIFLTSWGFASFARLSQSEIFQLFGITVALVAYLIFMKDTSFPGYLLFWLGLVWGGLSKGHTAFAAGIFPVLFDTIINRRFYHLNLKNLLAFTIASAIYFLPFVGTAIELKSNLPFHLLIRENLQQAIRPYDNIRPFYIYFYYWPAWLAPWCIFLPLSLWWGIKNFGALNERTKFLLIANIVIFCIFTLAKARRSYYILPILPYSTLLIAAYLENNWNEILKKVCEFLSILLFIALSLSPFFIWLCLPLYYRSPVPHAVIIASLIIAVIGGILFFMKDKLGLFKMALYVALMEVLFLCFLQPYFSTRSQKEIAFLAKECLNQMEANKTPRLCAYKGLVANVYFYLDIRDAVPVYDSFDLALRECDLILGSKKSLMRVMPEGRLVCREGLRGRKAYCFVARDDCKIVKEGQRWTGH